MRISILLVSLLLAYGTGTEAKYPTKIIALLRNEDGNVEDTSSTIKECENSYGDCYNISVNFHALENPGIIMGWENYTFNRNEGDEVDEIHINTTYPSHFRIFLSCNKSLGYPNVNGYTEEIVALSYNNLREHPHLNGHTDEATVISSRRIVNCGQDCHVIFKGVSYVHLFQKLWG